MTKNRLEAFSNGVFAIIITIMVLELKIPHGSDAFDLLPLVPKFISYVISFVYIGIYWNNHHHLIHTVRNITAGILWSNMHLLFWLSLIPFATGWVGENNFAMLPMSMHGFFLLMAGTAYFILQAKILKNHGGKTSVLAKAIGKDLKGKSSVILYIISIPAACLNQWITAGIIIFVALIWLIPDKRIEKVLEKE